jgi:hypothetical protein
MADHWQMQEFWPDSDEARLPPVHVAQEQIAWPWQVT